MSSFSQRKKIYCGTKVVPVGQVRGSAKECLQSSQVRFYGINKIDPALLKQKKYKKQSTYTNQLNKMVAALQGMKRALNKNESSVKNTKDRLSNTNDKKEKTRLNKRIISDEKKIEKIKNRMKIKINKYKELKKESEEAASI